MIFFDDMVKLFEWKFEDSEDYLDLIGYDELKPCGIFIGYCFFLFV